MLTIVRHSWPSSPFQIERERTVSGRFRLREMAGLASDVPAVDLTLSDRSAAPSF